MMFNHLKVIAMGYYDDDETYDQYNGTYVQDVEGWSDQMIDYVLDGEPDAYWNIDWTNAITPAFFDIPEYLDLRL